MAHDELQQQASEFLSKAFKDTTQTAPVHLVQAAVSIVLSQDPKALKP